MTLRGEEVELSSLTENEIGPITDSPKTTRSFMLLIETAASTSIDPGRERDRRIASMLQK